MRNDFLKELRFLGLIARFKRLSDSMLYSIRELYQERGLDIEPNWHLIFLFLKKHKRTTMTEITDALHFSQPAVAKMIKRMGQKGYVNIRVDKSDNRKKHITLSAKSKRRLVGYETIWGSGERALKALFSTEKSFLKTLASVEKEIFKTGFKVKIEDQLMKVNKKSNVKMRKGK